MLSRCSQLPLTLAWAGNCTSLVRAECPPSPPIPRFHTCTHTLSAPGFDGGMGMNPGMMNPGMMNPGMMNPGMGGMGMGMGGMGMPGTMPGPGMGGFGGGY